ncbi:hypothetical protein [Lewinella sp. JB7]|uniref:hypothetical protein n=1 Tax=Lewinella sp. JB7 TaxID=2962887 RepID=UPI0020C96E47|nr:hypothetical protein [Lewinella sp. JB7]MCP9236852.1 hypothetical protein [Lewinella sp. JB7]
MYSKNLWHLTLIYLLLLNILCCNPKCVKEEVVTFFDNELSIIEENLGPDYIIGGRSMIAVFTLQEVTGIQSSVRFGDTSVYPGFDGFNNDKLKWMRWLDENGCELSIYHVESILEKVKAEHPYLISSLAQ